MQKQEVKPKSELDLGKLTKKVFRFWRADISLPSSSTDQEATSVNICDNSQREEIASALVNAEFRKAQALMEHRRHVIC